MFSTVAGAAPASNFNWGPYRGMTASVTMSEQDVADFSKTGGNLLRVGFSQQPLMNKQPPYDFNEAAFAKLDQIISWARTYNVKIIIDPHTTPGTQRTTTTLPKDELWQDTKYHDLLNKLWERIATELKGNNDVIVGYDLLNEPAAKKLFEAEGAADYNRLYTRLIATIRAHDPDTPIIIEPAVGRDTNGKWVNRIDGIRALSLPTERKIIVSPHVYEPHNFTHQGVRDIQTGAHYPGMIDGQYWDKAALRQALAPIRDWQLAHHAVIYTGEFSASAYSGEDGNRYVQDLIDIFEEYGWSWTYHSWRSAPVWDPEKIAAQTQPPKLSAPNDESASPSVTAGAAPSTPPATRLDILKSAFIAKGE